MFGAYTHCSWPKEKDHGPVSDPSGQSFLFSLVNATNKAVRFSLRNKNDAIALHTLLGAFFGGHGAGFVLNCNAGVADEAENQTRPLTEHSAYQPDDGDMTRGVDFFAGSQLFAAADIEVYEI